jgi:tripartite-type tricarboxylate transporter receptor subunit TctC
MGWHARTISVNFLLLSFFAAVSCQCADAAEQPFYTGKTITVVIATAPGGTGGLRYTTVMKFLPRYVLGNPTIRPHYLPGAGGVAAANHLANVVKRDGLTLGASSSALYTSAILGATGVRYKLDDFVFLGAPYSGGPHTLVVRPDLHLDTVEKLRAYKGLRFANRSVGHALYIIDRLFAYVLELNDPKWVLGYNQQEIDLALERAEADALVSTLHSFARERLSWLEKGYTVPVVLRNPKGRGGEFVREFPPSRAHLDQFADTPLKRAILQFHGALRPSASVLFAPKGIPETAVRELKLAFSKVWSDPQFAEEYARLIAEPNDPITGEEIEKVLAELPRDPKIMQTYKEISGLGALPPAR